MLFECFLLQVMRLLNNCRFMEFLFPKYQYETEKSHISSASEEIITQDISANVSFGLVWRGLELSTTQTCAIAPIKNLDRALLENLLRNCLWIK